MVSSRTTRAGRAEIVVVGAGVVGLAIAAALARAGHGVLVLERNDGIGRETTSRNSGVLHAGLYYPTGTLKAQLCVEGRERVLARCAAEGIPHRRLGKIVVATCDEEVPTLERLYALGRANGALDLSLVDAAEVARLEPDVSARAALLSPGTGIVDPEALALSFAAEAERHGALLVLGAEVVGIERAADRYRVCARRPDGALDTAEADAVVNAAGLGADRVAALAGLDVDALGLRQHPCKGDYFALAPAAPLRFHRLVYPVPAGAGLGVHVTLDLGGRVRFGPDAEYVSRLDTAVDPAKAGAFAAAARRYLPRIDAAWLTPDMAGIRPKLAGPGEGFRDFVIREETAAGFPRFVSLGGIESPGLTSSPAIAERVRALLA